MSPLFEKQVTSPVSTIETINENASKLGIITKIKDITKKIFSKIILVLNTTIPPLLMYSLVKFEDDSYIPLFMSILFSTYIFFIIQNEVAMELLKENEEELKDDEFTKLIESRRKTTILYYAFTLLLFGLSQNVLNNNTNSSVLTDDKNQETFELEKNNSTSESDTILLIQDKNLLSTPKTRIASPFGGIEERDGPKTIHQDVGR